MRQRHPEIFKWHQIHPFFTLLEMGVGCKSLSSAPDKTFQVLLCKTSLFPQLLTQKHWLERDKRMQRTNDVLLDWTASDTIECHRSFLSLGNKIKAEFRSWSKLQELTCICFKDKLWLRDGNLDCKGAKMPWLWTSKGQHKWRGCTARNRKSREAAVL